MEPSPSRYHGSSATNPAAAHSPAAPPVSVNSVPANSVSRVRFGGEDTAHSLAEMARRDLDAALQLLADRAQYITGATGAAIALRRNGRNDMLCRASTGSNAPELGALLSTEYGLSGESVRTRQPLRCDDAERDVRVNREVCRQLGIASVVVMPVVNDDEVLGVFELFSGEVNAFGERDLSAVQRLSQLVETAVRLAEIAENLPEQLRTSETSAPGVDNAAEVEDKVLEGQILDESGLEDMIPQELIPEEVILEEPVLQAVVPAEPKPKLEVTAEASAGKADLPQADLLQSESLAEKGEIPAAPALPDAKIPVLPEKTPEDAAPMVVGTIGGSVVETVAAVVDTTPEPPKTVVPKKVVAEPQSAATKAEPVPAPSVETTVPKKPLFWSAEIHPAADAAKLEEVDHSHVPPVLRSLRKCEACGFPISAGRVLCVECEEKKWRGQLKVPRAAATPRRAAIAVPMAPPASGLKTEGLKTEAPTPKTEARALGAAAQSVAGSIPTFSRQPVSGGMKDPKEITEQLLPRPAAAGLAAPQTMSARAPEPLVASSPAFVLSAGLEPAQSWLSANKYVIGVLLAVGIVVAAFLLLR